MMTLHEIAHALNSPYVGDAVQIEGIGTDTRKPLTGVLYVALRGENFDGHDFVPAAIEQGAVAALVQRGVPCGAPSGFPLIEVDDTRLALGTLAAWWRKKFDIPLIGITGSNGKTSVKEMCAAILRTWMQDQKLDSELSVLATQGNLNNDIGLPLMLLRLRQSHRAAVFEMGMNHPGEIAYLTKIAEPTVALVNNAQRAHLEGMGDLMLVAQEKCDIYTGLRPEGVAIVNADDPHAVFLKERAAGHKVLSFGLHSAADVRATCTPSATGHHISLHIAGQIAEFDLQIPGVHNVQNALAAASAAFAVGVPVESIVRGLSQFKGVKGRLQRRETASGAVLFDDSYNANPDSVRAGIDVLANMPGKKILVLGDMAEIGDMSAQCHDEIGGYAKSQGIDCLLALGESSAIAVHNFGSGAEHFRKIEELVSALKKLLDKNSVVLVKGSRFMKMERVCDALALDKQ